MTKILALHGFLGQSLDWTALSKHLPLTSIDLTLVSHPKLGLKAWGNAFKPEQRILLGYSLGGRLALHALAAEPSRWEAAVIISTHPGLKSEGEKQKKLLNDRSWADRFRTEPWPKLMEAWNRQPVFLGRPQTLKRNESDYNRELLGEMLTGWSLGTQEDLSGIIAMLPMPILWIAGEDDVAYSKLAKSLTFANPRSKVWIAPQAGHRVPWEQSEMFCQQVRAVIPAKKS